MQNADPLIRTKLRLPFTRSELVSRGATPGVSELLQKLEHRFRAIAAARLLMT